MTSLELFYNTLIGEVKKYEVIYNNAHPDRIEHSNRQQAWKSISKTVGVPIQQCKNRWTRLRVRYILEYSKMANPKSRTRWKHIDEMDFMKDFVGPNSSQNFLQKLALMSKRDLFCRACLCSVKVSDQSAKSYNIFETDDVVEKLVKCTNLQVERSDNYPHSLCEKCYKKLLDFYQFQCMCRDSLDKFNIMLENQLTSEINNDEDEIPEEMVYSLIEIDDNTYKLEPVQMEANGPSVGCSSEMSADSTPNSIDNLTKDTFIVDPLAEQEYSKHNCKHQNVFSVVSSCNESDQQTFVVEGELEDAPNDKTEIAYSNEMFEEFIELGLSSEDEENQGDTNNEKAVESDNKSSFSDDLKTTKTPNTYPYKCDLCPKSFRYQHNLEAHLRRHQGLPGFLCTYETCERAFDRLDELRRHLDKHNGIKKTYKCDIDNCYEVFASHSGLRSHRRVRHNIGKPINKSFECEVCHTILKSHVTLKAHRFIHMDKSQWPFACDVEGCKVRFRVKMQKTIHLRRHAGIKKYVCPHCGVRKTTPTELNTHINFHTFEKKFPCSFCPKVLRSSASRCTHIRKVHEGKKPALNTSSFDCPCRFCGRKLSNPQSLKLHEMTHTGEKPYECNECGKTFASPMGRHAHMQAHSKGEQLHKCDECGKTFKWISSLKTHMKLHVDGAVPYACDQCGQGFRWSGSMYAHKKRHHSKLNEDNPCEN